MIRYEESRLLEMDLQLRFVLINASVIYFYFSNLQCIDEDEFGGAWELTKEGFMTSLAGFLVTWIIIYSGLYQQTDRLL
ncbi:hypothetical protein NQ317_018063 [Molorchus minor]|uniref:Uncharacterized protein n=1 Tax=Molorchus minor TaxID=1323400 RepID=A0ABQ9JID5_9CUCU|nr:hypothetical protein NQ317_018063 [Molorchus minor]